MDNEEKGWEFSLHHRVQAGSGVQRSLLINGYKGLFRWGKAAEA